MIALTCQECGEVYYRPPSAARRSRFCSNTCRARESSRKLTKNLIGQCFGRWTVKERAPNGASDQTRWLCECNCGNRRIVHRSSLIRDRSKSCGCLKKELATIWASDKFSKPIQHGKQFERLTVEHENGRSNGLITYLCTCVCGNQVTVRSAALRSGNTKSCGCLSIDMLKERSTTHGLSNKPHYSRWCHQVRREADSEWTIEMNDALLELQPGCVVCGSVDNLSIDHVLPLSKGYGLKPGNAVILCKSCNSRKRCKDLSKLPVHWRHRIRHAAREFAIVWES